MGNAQAPASATSTDLTTQLAHIDRALADGEVESARRLAEALLERGRGEPSGLGDVSARLRMAYCDLAESRVKRARDGARSAAAKFREAGGTSDEIDALSLLSRAATQLGRSVDAVEAGAMAVRLSEEVPQGRWTARAHLSLAIAYAWGGAAVQADRTFEAAGQAARLHADVAGQLEVSVERLWGQLLRWARERQGQDIAPVFGQVTEVVALQRGWEDASDAEPLTPGGRHGLRASVKLAMGLASLWSKGVDAVRGLMGELDSELGPAGTSGWMLAAQSWLQAEVAVQEGRFEPAAMYASRMADWSRDAGNLPLASLGSALATSICIRQGRFELALTEQAKGLADERAMGVHHLDGRAELVEALWTARQSETRINDLAAEARKYEAWALQDALTGIANRRQLTQCLEAWSAQAADSREPLCAALIDVDRFKVINDSFSHNVGDEVLTTIARKMVDHVREADLAARWGGDEFAILFRNTDVATAVAISERIEQSVQAHDWSLVAPELRVSVSVGVVEAQPGDNKHSLVDRSDKAMYARKRARAQAELTRTLSPVLVQQMTAWLKRATRVAFFVGSGTGDGAKDPASSDNLAAWDTGKRAAFGHVSGLLNHPGEFEAYWRQWRIDRRSRRPLSMHQAAVKLSHLLPETLFVTERVDGILPMAGADNVIELYGNAFRNRCNACGRVSPSSDNGRCVPCGSPSRTIRPDIVLLGEEPDIRLLAGAELFIKRADVVFVLDCDATTFPGAGLLEKARTRGAHIIMLGSGSRTHRGVAEVSVPASPEFVLNALSEALAEPGDGVVAGSALSADGFAMLAFLSGHGTDSHGNSLDQVLKWSNYEIATRLATVPWMFPSLTRSQMNPEAPIPTRDDFREFAKDEHVRSGVRKAFLMMLRFYGFHWTDGRVEKGPSWQQGFATWALQPSAHDLFISRVLGSAILLGLEAEARAFLQALEPEVVRYRGDGAAGPLGHWRLAVQG
jgi:diguanylate cyclase (GGDEF)-like protein